MDIQNKHSAPLDIDSRIRRPGKGLPSCRVRFQACKAYAVRRAAEWFARNIKPGERLGPWNCRKFSADAKPRASWMTLEKFHS